ncbi:MAG: nucleotidyltransferase family protein [Anaerolineales bacterium]|nr:nucleotidyltransferase family protein [Anaerolineales bacterium]MCB8954681.1 nucleotidyltransferase family protein [Ardenticatenales bacterium]
MTQITLPDFTLGPEWALLELACWGLRTEKEQQMFDGLLQSDAIHWGEVLEQAVRHRIMPLLAYCVTTSTHKDAVPMEVKYHLYEVLDVNRHKMTLLYQAIVEIIQNLREANIRFACTKGISFSITLYAGQGSRNLNDVDIMILAKDRGKVMEIMDRLGYETGLYSYVTDRVEPLPRRQMITYKLNPDHIPTLSRQTHDPIVRFVKADFANSLTWTGSNIDIPVERALAQTIEYPIPGFSDVTMPFFLPEYQFIFTALHLFREAWKEQRWQSLRGKDVNLSKFADIWRLWHMYPDELQSDAFVRLLQEFEIVPAILWVLYHADQAWHMNSVATLGLEDQVDMTWLNTASAPGNRVYQWRGTMRERLHCKVRRDLFDPRPVALPTPVIGV